MITRGLLALTLLLFLSVPESGAEEQGMANSRHNLSPEGLKADDEQICYWCHTPHAAYSTELEGTLWDKKKNSSDSFKMYQASLTGEVDPDTGLGFAASSPSVLVCLGCHDGVNAPNRLITIDGQLSTADDSGLNPLASSLAVSQVSRSVSRTDEHPVFIEYRMGGKANLRHPDTSLLQASGLDWGRAKSIRDLLRDNRVECVSCHDPHKDTPAFLRVGGSKTFGNICSGCHDK